VTQDLGKDNKLNSPMAKEVVTQAQPKINESDISNKEPPNNQPNPHTRKSGGSIITIFLSILVIILLISTIVSIAMLSSEIGKINEKLDDTKEDKDDLSDELNQIKSKLNNVSLELNVTRNDYNELINDYNELVDSYNDLKGNYDELKLELNDTKNDYDELNEDYDELQTQIKSNKIPHPSFIPETINPYQTEVIRFDGSGSNDVDGEIIEYRWDFGNGDFRSGDIVDYSFDEEGEHTVTLTVKDNNSTKNSTSAKITVENAIIITISEVSEYYNPDDYTIILTFKNNGDLTAHTDNSYWSLKTVDGTSYSIDYRYNGANTVGGGKSDEFGFRIYDVTGVPNKLIFNDSPFYQEVDINI
jgi:archaellum component FlaC